MLVCLAAVVCLAGSVWAAEGAACKGAGCCKSCEHKGNLTKEEAEKYAQTERQTIYSYTSLVDGTPDNRLIAIGARFGYETFRNDQQPHFSVGPELKVSYKDFAIRTHATERIGDGSSYNDAAIGWQQRWVTESGNMPTLSTLLEVGYSRGTHHTKDINVDIKIMGIAAKNIWRGTAYANVWGTVANESYIHNERRFQPGMMLGYKWRTCEQFSLIGAYGLKAARSKDTHVINTLELAAEYRPTSYFSVGPGIVIGLDGGEETPTFGAGITSTFRFGF